jgi:hypothetical protein
LSLLRRSNTAGWFDARRGGVHDRRQEPPRVGKSKGSYVNVRALTLRKAATVFRAHGELVRDADQAKQLRYIGDSAAQHVEEILCRRPRREHGAASGCDVHEICSGTCKKVEHMRAGLPIFSLSTGQQRTHDYTGDVMRDTQALCDFKGLLGVGYDTARRWVYEKGLRSVADVRQAVESGELRLTPKQQMGVRYEGEIRQKVRDIAHAAASNNASS